MNVSFLMTNQVITASGSEPSPHSVIGDSLSVEVIVSAVSGTTPSATFSIQWSSDGVNFADASPVDSFSPITAVGNIVQRFNTKGLYYRLSWSVTGTAPSLTTTIEARN